MLSLSIQEAARCLSAGSLTSTALIMQSCKRMDHIRDLNAFISEYRESALAQAAEADRRREANQSLGSIDGIPFAVKDNFCMAGTRTSCASKMLDNFTAPYSATVVEKTIAGGGIVMGKTNLDEFGMGSGTIDSVYGPTRNIWRSGIPYRLEDSSNSQVAAETGGCPQSWRIAGGSSGGSAVAVASGAVLASLGSDTGGSVRIPAAWCGIPSIKPTYGAVSRHGLIPLVNSLDVPGLMAARVGDLQAYLAILAGRDNRDSTTVEYPQFNRDREEGCEFNPGGITVGVPSQYFCEGMEPDVIEAVSKVCEILDTAGAKVIPVSLPHTELAIPCYSVLNPCEVASNMARYDGLQYGLRGEDETSTEAMFAQGRSRGFNEVVRGRILAGNYFLLKEHYNEYFLQALKIRRLVQKDFLSCWSAGVDLLLTPVTLSPAPLYSEYSSQDNRTQTARQDHCTQPVNLAGLPAATLPVSLSPGDSLPLSVQLIGPLASDWRLLAAAHWLEQRVNFPRLVLEMEEDVD